MSDSATTARELRRGMFGNPKRWRNAEQARAKKLKKRRAALRRHARNGLAPLLYAELKDLPLEVISQLSRKACETYANGNQ